MAVAFVKDFFLVVASKCPEDESGNFLEVLEEVLYYFLLAKRGVATISKNGGP